MSHQKKKVPHTVFSYVQPLWIPVLRFGHPKMHDEGWPSKGLFPFDVTPVSLRRTSPEPAGVQKTLVLKNLWSNHLQLTQNPFGFPGCRPNPWPSLDTSLLWPCTPSTSTSSRSRGGPNPEPCSRVEPSCTEHVQSCCHSSTLNWSTCCTEKRPPWHPDGHQQSLSLCRWYIFTRGCDEEKIPAIRNAGNRTMTSLEEKQSLVSS